jgi:hypothetical protein
MSGAHDMPPPDAEDNELELAGVRTADLPELPLAELRTLRDQAVATETGMSYLRRLVQGPLDLVRRELDRRAEGDRSDVSQLIEDLPAILAEHGRSAGTSRLPLTLEPSEVDAELAGELDRLTKGGTLIAGLPDEDDDELVELAAGLDALERTVSKRRRRLHRTIDVLNGELARRYRSGDATVEGTLSGS